MKKLILVCLGIMSFSGAGFLVAKAVNESFYTRADVSHGKAMFAANCAVCHGEQGRGDGPASHAMAVKPDDIYKELTNPFGFKAELIDSVLSGDNGQDGTMPAFRGVLTEQDIVDIFGYVASVNQPQT